MRESFVVAADGTELYLRSRPRLSRPATETAAQQNEPTTILCDGIACDGFIWKYLWDAIAVRTPVAHFHYRGHGRSKFPVDPGRITVADHAADLNSVRLSLGDPDVVLVGHSMGCQVVLENYRLRPEKIRGLVLLCGAPGRVTHTFKGSDALAQLLPRLIDMVDRHPQIARALWGGVPPELSLRVALALGEIDKKLMEPLDLLPYLEHMVDIDLRMFLRMLRAAGDHSAEDLLPQVQVPTLVVAAERDSFTPPSLAESMAKALPHGELLVAAGTHALPLEQRALIESSILKFLDRVLTNDVSAAAAPSAAADEPDPMRAPAREQPSETP